MITLKDAHLQLGGKPLLQGTDLTLFNGQKVGITGQNGCGKSTLFQLILGKLSLDNGDFSIPSQLRIAHMAQEVSATEREAVEYVLDGHHALRKLEQQAKAAEDKGDDIALANALGELESINGFQAKNQAEQLLAGLGFTPEQTTHPVSAFSGGWRIRLNLAQALMSDSDILLLDEPTNHLDLDATLWLEQWLNRYQGTLLLISHDRDFLDKIVTHIANFEAHKILLYKGNYSAYERQKAERLMQQQANFEKQQQRIEEIQKFVTRFKAKASKAKQAQSRLKELDRMEMIAPAHIDSPFHFRFEQPEKFSSPLVSLQHTDLGYSNHDGNDTPILKNVGISLLPGSRIGLLGPNGAGKSTLIKSIVGDLALMNGERSEGEHLSIGYFAQHQLEALDENASVFEHIQKLNPLATEQAVKDFVGGFNFRGARAEEPIKPFSGGEKARLALAMIAWQKPNLLLLDEPTNHLDLEMRHALEVALQGFEGALLVVSHDRHLLRNTVDQFWLVANGQVQDYDGDLEQYQQWLQQHNAQGQTSDTVANSENPEAAKVDKKQQRQQAAAIRKQLSPLKKQCDKAEKAIEKAQAKLDEIEQALGNTELYEASNKEQLQTLLQEQGQLKRQMEEDEEAWMELTEQLEEMEQALNENS